LDGLKALWILEENDNRNNKKLQFEASSRVVHKRSTSQNMPIWEHKRSNSVILSYMKFRTPPLGIGKYLIRKKLNYGGEEHA